MTPSAPLQSVDQVVEALRDLDRALDDADGLKWFNLLYLRVTGAVRDRIAAGDFSNPVWMAKLDVHFARYYFEALEAWQNGRPVPACWRALFQRRGEAAIARAQFALAGVNAHINHDLALALVDVFEETGAEPFHGGVQYLDYTSLNPTLSALVDEAREQWMVRLPGDGLPAVTHLQDVFAAWSLTAAREAAWTNAELLWDVRAVPLVAGRYLDVIDGLAAVAGKALLVPAPGWA
jgi:hypothetical protein